MTARLAAALILSALIAGCVTETYQNGALVWVDSVSYGDGNDLPAPPVAGPSSRGPSSPGEPDEREPEPAEVVEAKPVDPNSVVNISDETLKDMIALINRPQCILADRIEVDATRIPFKPALVPLADASFVKTADLKDLSGEPNGFQLEALAEQGMVERECPRLRVGDGIDCMASRVIRVRYHTDVGKNRPVFIRIRALGNAVYRDLDSGKRMTRDAITLIAELVQSSSGLVLRHSVE